MFQLSEILNLIFDSIGLVVIIALYQIGMIPRYKLLFIAFLFVWLSSVFTVLEGFFLPDLLNFLEHFSFLLSGVFFLFAVRVYFMAKQDLV
ncbi:hypothetical protein EHO59_17120 [Leptospira semungkisensis]|uniref:Uncharacterized protein n=1 Tax=Leptospira semungkisensis TaxID=2484985 RepID=A0A4R9FP76_9LEPT|nr:hypothetical protein EHO59_17120 [Leptospira semungkisensis]